MGNQDIEAIPDQLYADLPEGDKDIASIIEEPMTLILTSLRNSYGQMTVQRIQYVLVGHRLIIRMLISSSKGQTKEFFTVNLNDQEYELVKPQYEAAMGTKEFLARPGQVPSSRPTPNKQPEMPSMRPKDVPSIKIVDHNIQIDPIPSTRPNRP